MAKKTFETAISRLESITAELEQGELTLEESLKKFDEGIGLVKFCNDKLEDARGRVELLLKKNDRLTTEPFQEKDDSAA
ncbi:MAG: exodeoxyribonuclease VII small subunit [Desulfobulbus propionicus]|nr:MAG: exodeoxyribonuclease VII small subunit [Desulfobulbus propionicus]